MQSFALNVIGNQSLFYDVIAFKHINIIIYQNFVINKKDNLMQSFAHLRLLLPQRHQKVTANAIQRCLNNVRCPLNKGKMENILRWGNPQNAP